jgi:hypothetical protein
MGTQSDEIYATGKISISRRTRAGERKGLRNQWLRSNPEALLHTSSSISSNLLQHLFMPSMKKKPRNRQILATIDEYIQ